MTGAGDSRKKAAVPVQSIGNFVLDRMVAEGGWGRVYSAEHPAIGRRVAVKILRSDLTSNAEALSRFFNEARAANQIQNDHVVEILDFGQLPSGQPYIIMEWLEGRSLAQLLALEAPLEIGRALHILRQTANAIEAAHVQGVVHRDLKPDNIFLVTKRGDPDFVKLVDFGIAKLATPRTGSHKTGTGIPMGTPAYMSPEQCSGEATVDHRTDIYSFGVILYELVTGHRPFQAEGLGALLLKQMTERPRPPSHLNPQVPATLERAILKMLEKEPAMRPQTMAEVVHDLGWEPSQGYTPPPLPPPPVSGTRGPQTGGPQAGRPPADRPQTGRPQTGRPQTGRPQAGQSPPSARPIPPPLGFQPAAATDEDDDEATRVEPSPVARVDPSLAKTSLQRTMLQHGRPATTPAPLPDPVPVTTRPPVDLRSTAPQWKNAATEPEAPVEPAPAPAARTTQGPQAARTGTPGRVTPAAPVAPPAPGTPGRGTAAPPVPPGRGTAGPPPAGASPARGTVAPAAPAARPGSRPPGPGRGTSAPVTKKTSPMLFAALGLGIGAVIVVAVLLSRKPAPQLPPAPVPERPAAVDTQVTFHILTVPTGGVVYDTEGKVLGRAPLDVKVPKSTTKHTFLVRMPGFEPRTTELVADADRESKLQFAPPPAEPPPPELKQPEPSEPEPPVKPAEPTEEVRPSKIRRPKPVAKEPKEPRTPKEPKEPRKKKGSKAGKPASSGDDDELK